MVTGAVLGTAVLVTGLAAEVVGTGSVEPGVLVVGLAVPAVGAEAVVGTAEVVGALLGDGTAGQTSRGETGCAQALAASCEASKTAACSIKHWLAKRTRCKAKLCRDQEQHVTSPL